MNLPSTKKQRQLIAIGCSRVGISAGLRHEMLADRYGVDSSTKLTKNQAVDFLRELQGRGFHIQPKTQRPRSRRPRPPFIRENGGSVARLVSQAELDKIAAVASLIKWRVENGQELWMKKRFGIAKVRTAQDAYLVIEGLKKMFENGMRKSFGPGWWHMRFDDAGIMTYISEHAPNTARMRKR